MAGINTAHRRVKIRRSGSNEDTEKGNFANEMKKYVEGINITRLRIKIRRSNIDDDTENDSFVNEVKKCVNWTIENIHACPLVKGEYLESAPFFSGYLNNTKWTLRLYPRGRNSTDSENVGLFIKKDPSSATCSVNYEFKLLDSCPVDASFSSQSVSEDGEECGTDEFLSREELSSLKNLKIECNIVVTYFEEAKKYYISEEGFPNCRCVSLSEDLRNLYHQQKHVDTILKLEKKNIPAHRAILGARSKVFHEIFKEDMKKGFTPGLVTKEIIKGHTDESVVQDVIEYIYTGRVDNFTFNKAISMYPMAKRYSLEELKRRCTDKILATMSVEDFYRIAALAYIHQSAKLKLATKNFFCKYSAQILDTEEWKNFILEQRSMASELMESLASEIKTKC